MSTVEELEEPEDDEEEVDVDGGAGAGKGKRPGIQAELRPTLRRVTTGVTRGVMTDS